MSLLKETYPYGKDNDFVLLYRKFNICNFLDICIVAEKTALYVCRELKKYSVRVALVNPLKELSHEMDLAFDDMYVWLVLGLNRGMGHFLHFFGALSILCCKMYF